MSRNDLCKAFEDNCSNIFLSRGKKPKQSTQNLELYVLLGIKNT